MEWFINILPDILTAIVSALFGGLIGFKIGFNKKQKMIQKAGNDAQQVQIGGNYINDR